MNETGWRATGGRSRIVGLALATAALLACANPVLAKDHPEKALIQAAPKVDQKALKKQAQALRKQQQAVDKQQHAATKQQRAATKKPHLAAPAPRTSARPVASSPSAAATPIGTVASPRGRAVGNSRAANRRVANRRAAARRAARRAAAAPVVAAAPIAAATAQPAQPSVPHPRPHPATRRPAAAPKTTSDRSPVTVVGHTVEDIVHVIPGWAKAVILALAALLGMATLIILAAALRNRRLRALSTRLLEEVGTLSTALLPAIPSRVGSLAVSVAYRPAEGLAAGGDFYDVFALDQGRTGLVVGDVSGHGRESLGPANFIRHMVRSYLEAGLAPRAALQLAGKVVDEHDREDFATVVAAVHDPAAGTLSYASAGHPPPVFTGPGDHRPLTVASSPPIGVGERTGLRQTTVPLAPGSRVVFFTDGLFEVRRAEKIIGLPRLEEIVRDLEPDATAEQLVTRVGREADVLPDDIAVCIIRVDGDAQSSSTVRVEEIEVTSRELRGPRVRRFLEAGGIDAAETQRTISTAAAQAARHGSVVLRVRLAEGRSGVDVVPPNGSPALAPVHQLTA